MEIIHTIKVPKKKLNSFNSAKEMFEYATDYVIKYRSDELEKFWQQVIIAPSKISEGYFIREYTWCVYVAGFKATNISKIFDKLLKVHNIMDNDNNYIPLTKNNIVTDFSELFQFFKNKQKANAVQLIRKTILENGWDAFKMKYVDGADPIKLQQLPYMGPALSCHLARNLGNQGVCKPDVHLNRLATKYGYSNAQEMCNTLGSPIGYVDLILWIASIDNGTL